MKIKLTINNFVTNLAFTFDIMYDVGYPKLTNKEGLTMKKIVSVLLTIALLTTLALCVSADDAAKTRIYEAAKAACPAELQAKYLGTVQNTLNQIDVTAEQADAVIAIIDEAKAEIDLSQGVSLSEYKAEDRDKAINYVNKAAEILDVTVTFEAAPNPVHKGDMIAIVTYNGAKIADIDGETVKVTGGNAASTALFAVVSIALAGASVVVAKKYVD